MKSLFFTYSLIFFASTLHAEGAPGEGAPLTLDEVTRAVLANNPTIKEAFLRWDAGKERVVQSGAWEDLKVSASSRFARFVNISPNAFTDQIVSVEQMVPISGKNRSRARIAAAEAVSNFEEVRRQELDILTKARASYFRLANAYAQIELNRKNLVSLKQIAGISRSRYEVGNQTAADVFVAEIEASKVLEARRDLERELAAEQSQLNVLMDRDAFAPLGEPAEVAAEPIAHQIDELRELALAYRPEVKMAQAKIEAEKARLELAHRGWIPDPSLTIQGQRYNAAAQAVSEMDAGISFNIPWGNYKKYSAEVREADDNLGAAQQALGRTKKEAIGLLRDQFQKVETTHHHVELFRDKITPQAEQAFEATQLGYESAKSGFLDWINAQRMLREVQATAREHLTDYQVAVAELEGVIGVELPSTGASGASMKAASK